MDLEIVEFQLKLYTTSCDDLFELHMLSIVLITFYMQRTAHF